MLHDLRRAPYASDPSQSRGRQHSEETSRTRTEFQRDRDRIIHSAAFRRLAFKTQVFIPHEGDHYRTRLTHSIEVAQIARALSRSLGLDEDLAEALALAHDLGHTCFGHAGEDGLDHRMRAYGGFDHNAQTLRIVTRLERRYARYDGLNLSWETVEGLAKHNGPWFDREGRPAPGRLRPAAPIRDLDEVWPLDLARYSSAEAQAAALADDIAYNAHDVDDGLRAGVLRFEDLNDDPTCRALLADVDARHPGLEAHRRTYELTRRLITSFVEDATDESARRLALLPRADAEAVRAASQPVVAFSGAAEADRKAVKAFLTGRLYRHPAVMRVRDAAEAFTARLFDHLFERPDELPDEWATAAQSWRAPGDEARRARLVCDYIAGMTDRFALSEGARLFGAAPELGEAALR